MKRLLVFALLLGAIAVGVSVFWVFDRIEVSLGDNLAEVAVTFICMLVLALIVLGMRTGAVGTGTPATRMEGTAPPPDLEAIDTSTIGRLRSTGTIYRTRVLTAEIAKGGRRLRCAT